MPLNGSDHGDHHVNHVDVAATLHRAVLASRQCIVMRASKRKRVSLIAATVLLAVGFWVCLYRLTAPRGSVRRFEVHSSIEFHDLLLHSSTANCSHGNPLEVKRHSSFKLNDSWAAIFLYFNLLTYLLIYLLYGAEH
jgi:hypothetical protein